MKFKAQRQKERKKEKKKEKRLKCWKEYKKVQMNYIVECPRKKIEWERERSLERDR